jgi:uncharacterized phiE125 gp8 family phage protein
MTPILLEAPVNEPVLLAELKAYLKIDMTDEDGTLASLIAAARLTVEAASERKLIDQRWRFVLDDWPDGLVLRLPFSPVRQVEAIRIWPQTGVAMAFSGANIWLDAQASPARILFNALPPPPGRAIAGIEIDTVAGFGPNAADIPHDLRLAVLRLAARWFENRGDILRDEADGTPRMPNDLMALIAPYRQPRL